MATDLETRLRLTADKQEIHDVLMRYCRGVDRGDAELIASSFHPDAVSDLGSGPVSARESAPGIAEGLTKRGVTAMHFIGNVLIEVEGDVAYSEAYLISYLAITKEGQAYTRARGGRYVDRFERRDGEWKIALRVIVDDWNRLDPVGETQPPVRQGQRSHEDPVWTIRTGAFDRAPEDGAKR
jgi:ketosteroid isomerase-like protein